MAGKEIGELYYTLFMDLEDSYGWNVCKTGQGWGRERLPRDCSRLSLMA